MNRRRFHQQNGWKREQRMQPDLLILINNIKNSLNSLLKAVRHVSDWPLQSELNTTDFFVNLCI